MIAYFTGVRPGAKAGHYCFTPDLRITNGREPPSPWVDQGGSYPLGDSKPCRAAWPEGYDQRGYWRMELPQPEGLGRVVRQDGWTLVCLWDRSADRRGGSHASFALQADLLPVEALAKARELFPAVFARIERHLERAVVLDDGRKP